MKIIDLPKKISVFPLSNFIIFPKTTVPLNIFESRYIEMINDSMKSNKLIGMVQPKSSSTNQTYPDLHNIGCLGKIISFKETEDGRYLIELKGLIRFKAIKEIKSTSYSLYFLPDFISLIALNLINPLSSIKYRPSSVSLKLIIFPRQPISCKFG